MIFGLLAMIQIGDGISALLVRGQIAYAVLGIILTLGSGKIVGIPRIVIVAATMLLIAHIVLTYTRFGRYVYMGGGNREAAHREDDGVEDRLVFRVERAVYKNIPARPGSHSTLGRTALKVASF